MSIAPGIIANAKTRRVSVCNALDCLIVHASKFPELKAVMEPLEAKKVRVQADERAYSALVDIYPAELLEHAGEESFGTEFMSLTLAIHTVDSVEEAIDHVRLYGSGHSECIITEDPDTAALFMNEVDAACVYLNAPTSFTDGGQFGLGAEIGISTQKLGARGLMALTEITTYKWLITGHGQLRP